ncbi:biliverdin-producing heme oxygenase [Roseomonas sp. NAR14]|uniref:Biliverdin-producing heme oxygenase n=1 Tax=Roseomonas acroporae TaxID=2937791 RepID=A0A9X2BSB1_9PROT|nr:biliverdin-producing heme oxygenase [Roseomonas acroporae]MCK8782952.1 biliverdin-producing heme oxygenase [Roseomonas acroporae]
MHHIAADEARSAHEAVTGTVGAAPSPAAGAAVDAGACGAGACGAGACGTPSGRGRRDRLRHGTAELHAALDAALTGAGYFDDAMGYRRYLLAVLPLQQGLEAALDLAGAAALLPDWPARRRAPLGRSALARLGDAPVPPAVLPVPAGRGAVLAGLYVLEGATLGGAVLARRLREVGVPPPALRFLDPHGARRGAMWRGFLARLEAAPLSPGEEAALCPAARAVFARFAACLLPSRRPPATQP